MALLQNNKKRYIYLFEHHTLGRLAEKVDTLVDDSFVSRIHAVIQWIEPNWILRDVSSNGTWVNGKKLTPNQKYPLSINDSLQFGEKSADIYTVTDESPPADVLLRINGEDGEVPEKLTLNNYHFLPDEYKPSVALYKKQGSWYVDDFSQVTSGSSLLNNKETLSVNGINWQLCLLHNSNTQQIEDHEESSNSLHISFHLSLNEEYCDVTVSYPGKNIDLSSHSHHLLTAMLARYRAKDIQNGLTEPEQGWAYMEQLSKDMGLEERHINIQIHRARKQLLETMSDNTLNSNLVERRRGQIRLGFTSFQIIKGGQLEYSSI